MEVGCFVFAIILVLYITKVKAVWPDDLDDESGSSDQQQSFNDELPYYTAIILTILFCSSLFLACCPPFCK